MGLSYSRFAVAGRMHGSTTELHDATQGDGFGAKATVFPQGDFLTLDRVPSVPSSSAKAGKAGL
jgi:hypothetical protein